MTPRDIELVQTSFAKVALIADQAATMFYARLFELDQSLGVAGRLLGRAFDDHPHPEVHRRTGEEQDASRVGHPRSVLEIHGEVARSHQREAGPVEGKPRGRIAPERAPEDYGSQYRETTEIKRRSIRMIGRHIRE